MAWAKPAASVGYYIVHNMLVLAATIRLLLDNLVATKS